MDNHGACCASCANGKSGTPHPYLQETVVGDILNNATAELRFPDSMVGATFNIELFFDLAGVPAGSVSIVSARRMSNRGNFSLVYPTTFFDGIAIPNALAIGTNDIRFTVTLGAPACRVTNSTTETMGNVYCRIVEIPGPTTGLEHS